MRALIAFILTACSLNAQLTNLSFQWNPASPSEAVVGYYFHVKTGTNWQAIGFTTTNYFTVTNHDIATLQEYTITATNAVGETDKAPSLKVPVGIKVPARPDGLKLVPLSLPVPLPGTVELSTDLVDWRQRIQIQQSNSTALLTWTQYPDEPVMFLRQRTAPPISYPPPPTQ